MHPGEFAVHFSFFSASSGARPFCVVFSAFGEAQAFADQQIAASPALCCGVYDHQGIVGPPLYEARGAQFKDRSGFTPGFRRWTGSILFFAGLVLTFVDWSTGFRLSWPAMLGTRMLIPGLALLVTEAMILIGQRQNRRRADNGAS